ncbi:metal-dependent enzyme [Thermotoga sp. Ku-13t]|uniref:DUF1385 domain-containing protein n=1 Tax=Thermotoga sp. Ku-13t TaxID=1755813 RepID=UPI0013ECF965|nr:DUF1385 domain-containing protein [Thermotoga sp. Ku-13t]KAF2958759.1 metal-dependent enzyme [Thermotoga sp. Ku-13t]
MRIGGQAIIEGVLMLGNRVSMAVRDKDGNIVVEDLSESSVTANKLFRVPFLRGFVSLYFSLYFGIKALNRSAELSSGEKIKKSELFWTTVFAFALALGLFVVLPMWITGLFSFLRKNEIAFAIVEGILRLILFVLYVWIISFFPDVKRIFQYHGAEHMVINAYENGEQLQLQKIKKYSTIHPRCGTSFVMIFLFFSVVILSLVSPLASKSLVWRFFSRLVFLPLTAGFAYEFLRISAKGPRLLKILSYPGLFFQKLTTARPDDSQLEVAIAALKRVLPDSAKSEGPEYLG